MAKVIASVLIFFFSGNAALAADLTCSAEYGSSGMNSQVLVEGAIVSGDSITLVVNKENGKSVTGSLVSDEDLGSGARVLEPGVAETSGYQATVLMDEGVT